MKFHLTNGIRPLSFNLQNHFEKVFWFLKEGLEKECLWQQSLSFQFSAEIPKYSFMSFLFSIGKMVALYPTFSELHLSPSGHSSPTLQLHNGLLKPCLSTKDFSIKFLLWLLMILYELLLQE